MRLKQNHQIIPHRPQPPGIIRYISRKPRVEKKLIDKIRFHSITGRDVSNIYLGKHAYAQIEYFSFVGQLISQVNS